MEQEQMLEELQEMIYRNHYPDPESDRIQPLSERPKWEQELVLKTAAAILKAGYRKLPIEAEGEMEYCLEITPVTSGEPLNRDAYWGDLKTAERDLRYYRRANNDRLKKGLPIHFTYGIVRRFKTVLYSQVEVVAESKELP
jgi:hypothetical protein